MELFAMDKSVALLMLFTITDSAYMKEKQIEMVDDILNSDGSWTEDDGYDGPREEEVEVSGNERKWNNFDEWISEPASWGPADEYANATVMKSREIALKKYINDHLGRGEERQKKEILRANEGEGDIEYYERLRATAMFLRKREVYDYLKVKANKNPDIDGVDEDNALEDNQKEENEDSENYEEYSEN